MKYRINAYFYGKRKINKIFVNLSNNLSVVKNNNFSKKNKT